MLDQKEANDLIYRIGFASIRWYPEKSSSELDYTLDEDIDWCLEVLTHVPEQYLASMRGRVAQTITDPTTYRAAIVRDVLNLVRN